MSLSWIQGVVVVLLAFAVGSAVSGLRIFRKRRGPATIEEWNKKHGKG